MTEEYEGIAAAIEAGKELAEASDRIVDIGITDDKMVPVAIVPNGFSVHTLDKAIAFADNRAERPRAIIGVSDHTELDSFLAHIEAFKNADSAVWADITGPSVTAIYNYHARGKPAWGDHRANYSCPKSDEWSIWTAHSERRMSQDAFSDFIEERFDDITSPKDGEDGATAVDVLEMARNLAIHTKGRFERKIDKVTGENSMVCKEEHSETSTKIPRRFFIAIPVFENGVKYRVEARMRFRMQDGRPSFGFSLHRVPEILRDAFKEICESVRSVTGLPVYAGTHDCRQSRTR